MKTVLLERDFNRVIVLFNMYSTYDIILIIYRCFPSLLIYVPVHADHFVDLPIDSDRI